jgi:hypothetical protein
MDQPPSQTQALDTVAPAVPVAIPAPIPSPFPDASVSQGGSTVVNGERKATPVVPIIIGLGIGAALFALKNVIGLMPIALVIISANIGLSLYGTMFVKMAGKRLNYTVRSQDDIEIVKRTIDLNMKWAYALMVTIWPFFFVAILSNQFGYSVFLMLYSLPFGLWGTSVENKFKTMSVEGEDPSLRVQYDKLVAYWKEPRFGLPK